MAAEMGISNAAAIAACNAVVDLLDVGGAGYVEIRTGTQPTYVDDVVSGTLLVTITLNNPAFGAAADATPGAVATADVSPALSATATGDGTAGYFRAYNNGGTAVLQGTCGTSLADMILNSASISVGATVSVTSWTITMPEK